MTQTALNSHVDLSARLKNASQVLANRKIVSARRVVKGLLFLILAMILSMVIVGGATRLTNSGLSITEWNPIMGAIPPISTGDWEVAFQKYQQSSQYRLQNLGMSLGEFQYIFWWEWAHRFLGRMIGLPFLVLLGLGLTGRMEWQTGTRIIGLFVLLGLQGALGWYMVASGLVNRVDVSQYRLAAHLTLATIFFAATLWTVLAIDRRHVVPRNIHQWTSLALVGLVFLQIAAGGLVAGLDAGQGYNTWPQMDGQFIPSGLYAMKPAWLNIFENAMTVQFNHRALAYVVFAIAIWHALSTRAWSSTIVFMAVGLQATLGILTLLWHVPLTVALVHQAGALAVLTAALWNLHRRTRYAIA